MQTVIGVRFKKAGKIYYFSPGKLEIAPGDDVIVETARGVEYGKTVIGPREVPDEEVVLPLKVVHRKATEADARKVEENHRREQEAFATRLAAQRATAADKERLSAIREELEAAWLGQDAEAESEADFRLHRAVVDASHNTTLIHMMASVYDLTRRGIFYNHDLLRSIDDSGRKLLDQHIEIIESVLSADPVRAEVAARDHMDYVEESIRRGRELQRREQRARMRFKSGV